MRFTMRENKLLLALALAISTSITACGGDGDANQNVVRNLFAVGDTFEGLEDSDPIEGDVSKNDQGDGLTFTLNDTTETGNGTLVFNEDGTFIYTPNPDFSGNDYYTYTASQASTGESDSAILTIKVLSDFETIAEAGWTNTWRDDFDGDSLNETIWLGNNTTVADGYLVISSVASETSTLNSLTVLPYGRFEARIQLPVGSNISSAFGAMPMADIYDGENGFTAAELDNGRMIAAAHYGLNITNGVGYNSDSVVAATSDFHTYAVEWNEDNIRWYFDGVHIHTVDMLNVWSYNLSGDEVIPSVHSANESSGPFNQDLQLFFDLESNSAEPTTLLVDYVNVWTCDPTVAPEINQCASNINTSIDKLASDLIPLVAEETQHIFIDGVYDEEDADVKISNLETLSYHYTDQVIELSISGNNSPVIETITLENDHNLVIDVTSTAGDANIAINAPGVAIIGHDAVLSFDMYIDSANTLTEIFDIRMETGWPYMGMITWNTAELTLDTWVTYSIPVSNFINSPFVAPDWFTWDPNIAPGDILPLDPNNIGSLLTIEFQDATHIQLDNIYLTCISSENCIQGPLAIQEESGAKAPSTVYQAENFDSQSGIELENSADEGGGQNIGYADPGDYLEYSITAASDGTYYIDYRLATDPGSDGFEVSIDGVVVDTVTVEPTGGWQEWITQTGAEFAMTAGQHMLRIDFIGKEININWFEIFEPAFEIFIEAENYDAQSGIELENSADEGGGQNIGYADPGDSLEYSVNIPADGTYNIEYRFATEPGSDGFELSFDGNVVDTVSFEATGGWQEWVSQTSTIELVQGEQTMRVDFIGKEININWFKITK